MLGLLYRLLCFFGARVSSMLYIECTQNREKFSVRVNDVEYSVIEPLKDIFLIKKVVSQSNSNIRINVSYIMEYGNSDVNGALYANYNNNYLSVLKVKVGRENRKVIGGYLNHVSKRRIWTGSKFERMPYLKNISSDIKSRYLTNDTICWANTIDGIELYAYRECYKNTICVVLDELVRISYGED